jgi:hypothetical protein
MLNEEELKKLGVLDWSSIATKFKEADLLLGNGFSLNFSDRFDYNSLFEEFLSNCSPENRHTFEHFKTSNFEFILEKLSHAREVNQIFGIKTSKIEEAIEYLKDGLIKTIQTIHPRAGDIDKERLKGIAAQLDRFNDIFTLNYDLFLYHIIMILLDMHKAATNVRPYSDYFWDRYSTQFLKFVDHQDYPQYKLLYYLHGALFLFQESFDNIFKLRKADDSPELVELIREVIQEGRIPLFVSEGKHEQKMETINRSYYLQFALEKLENAESSLVIFGTSLSDQDQHIVDAINQNKRELAVSIHVGTKSGEAVEEEKYRINKKFAKHKVKFFNSETLFKL